MIMLEMLVIIILGCVLHFVYGWSHENRVVGWFSAVNESTWEHIKIALVPSFLLMLVDYGVFGDNANYWFGRFVMLCGIIVLIPVLFYGYKALTKRTISVVMGVMIFAIAVIYSVLCFNEILKMVPLGLEIVGGIGCGLVFLAVALLTLFPPRWFLFKDPQTQKFGFVEHTVSSTRGKRSGRGSKKA